MSRRDVAWLTDIVAAPDAIGDYLGDLSQDIVYDACRARLVEIGEAVKALDPELLAAEPDVPWRSIAVMRDHRAHCYFDTDHAIVADVVHNELAPVRAGQRVSAGTGMSRR